MFSHRSAIATQTIVVALIIGLVIGALAGWFSKPVERVTETVTETVTKTVTVTPAPTPTPTPTPTPPPPTELETLIGEFIDSTGFPLSFIGVSPVAPVDIFNLPELLEVIVDSTVILNVDSGVFIDAIRLIDALETREVSREQREAYKTDVVAGFLDDGDWVVKVDWMTDAGLYFSTLAILASDGTPEYEPVIYFAPPLSETLETTKSSESGSTTWVLTMDKIHENWWTIDVITINSKVIVRTVDECEIDDQSVLITFSTAPGWEAKATKEETLIKCGHCPVDPERFIEGKKVIITIVWANGFKKVKGEAGAGGFSASLEVEGTLGANGQQQVELIMCADGTASVDGKPVE